MPRTKTQPPPHSPPANTGASTNKHPNGQISAMPTTAGAKETSRKAATAATSSPNPPPSTNAGKPLTPTSETVRLPKPIIQLLKPLLNEAVELLIIPDSAVAIVTESTNKRLDPACWVIFRLPPIHTEPPIAQGTITRVK